MKPGSSPNPEIFTAWPEKFVANLGRIFATLRASMKLISVSLAGDVHGGYVTVPNGNW
jgi:hypothetical protein